FLGAKVVLTPAAEKGSGMLAKAVELAEKHDWFLCRQFENEANPNKHTETTAEEILADFADVGLDYWVTGYGTGGTLKGVARVLKARSPRTKIVVCEPDNTQMLGSGIPQARVGHGTPASSHALFRPHLMQGWSPDFIPKLTEDAVAAKLIDRVLPVNGGEAMRLPPPRPRAHAATRARARAQGRHLRRHVEWRDLRGRARGLQVRAQRLERALHAARHRRALFEHAAVRRHPGRHDRRGNRDRALDAALSVRRAGSEGRLAAQGAGARRGGYAQSGRVPRRGYERQEPARRDVRARVVRVLLVGAPDVRRVQDPVSRGRSR